MESTLSDFIPYDLGIVATDKRVLLYGNLLSASFSNPLFISESTNGLKFKSTKKTGEILGQSGNIQNTAFSLDFRISEFQKEYYLSYKSLSENTPIISFARSKDLFSWKKIANTKDLKETTTIVPNYKYENMYVSYCGEKSITVQFSKDLIKWENAQTVLIPQNNHFDKYPLKVGNIFQIPEGILVFYYVKEFFREGLSYSVGAALFDKNNPSRLLSKTQLPFLSQQLEVENGELYPLGEIIFQDRVIFYFGIRGKSVYAVSYGTLKNILSSFPGRSKPRLEKYHKNPIITPVMQHSWQKVATFNPAAVHDGEKFHFIYRAMGPENTSVLGHAESTNGTDIYYRSEKPIYVPRKSFELPGGSAKTWFMSGGGYGGCEDPRVTWIKEDKKFYLTYIAYNGSDAPRVALSSISEDDFKNKNWNWTSPKIISKPHEVNKNAVIFPEKIGGKYVVMHRVFPNILLDLMDDLNFKKPRYLKGEYKIPPTANGWDSRKVGAGPPPIKTPDGWLLIYHAVDDKNDSQYKIGAMLLDLNEPWKVLYRTQQPILEPDQWYENNGFKAGVAYPCGAVLNNGRLYVYYGGADTFTCVASKSIREFMNDLKSNHSVTLERNLTQTTVLHHD